MYETYGELLCSRFTWWHETAPYTLACRLLLVEQAGLRPLSVQANEPPNRNEPGWVKSDAGIPTGRHAYIAVETAGMDPDELRAKLDLAKSYAPEHAGDTGRRALEQLQQLQAEAGQEAARLNALLPPGLHIVLRA